ncbi:MAG: ABC transporter ATP-binding protein [Nitrososphaerales archaeon]
MVDAVELKMVSVYFESKCVLEDINLRVHENDFLGIIGPNGGGKTTLLKVIAGLIKPTKGSVEVYGRTPDKVDNIIGYVPQMNRPDLSFPATVWDVVLTGRLKKGNLIKPYGEADKAAALEALKAMDLEDLKDEPIGKLSGGQRQRVFIARALAAKPKLLLLDEPTLSVDRKLDTKFWEFLNELKSTATIIVVTHDISALSKYVDKIACLNRRLYYSESKQITREMWMEAYQCPVDIIAHGIPHRVVEEHS